MKLSKLFVISMLFSALVFASHSDRDELVWKNKLKEYCKHNKAERVKLRRDTVRLREDLRSSNNTFPLSVNAFLIGLIMSWYVKGACLKAAVKKK